MKIVKFYDEDLWVDPNWYVGRKIECEHCGFTCELEEGDEGNSLIFEVKSFEVESDHSDPRKVLPYGKLYCPTCRTIHTIYPEK